MEKDMEQIVVSTTHGNIQVYRFGDGPQAVLLLHGSGSDHAMLSWREVMSLFDGRYTVYALDFLGYGKSDEMKEVEGEPFFAMHIDCVKQVVDTLQLSEIILAGLSMGGAIAIGFSLNYQHLVKTLIPIAPWGITEKMPVHGLMHVYIHKTRWTETQFKWVAKYKWMAKWYIQYALINDKKKITPKLVQEVVEACQKENVGKSMLQFQRSAILKNQTHPYYLNELSDLKMPVIYIVGELDPLVPFQHAIKAAEHSPHGSCVVMKGCKHWAIKERPHEFVQMIHSKL